MSHVVDTSWKQDMQFDVGVDGHTLLIDAHEHVGGHHQGPIPKPLMLAALSGCTGMDVVSIMRKAKKLPISFDINVEGVTTTEHPIVYSSIHMKYLFEGDVDNIPMAIKAVQLSQDKYCGVSAMLKQIMPITWEIIYNDTVVFEHKQ